MGSDAIRVEVVYAGATEQFSTTLTLDLGATVADAVRRSGVEACFPELGRRALDAGVWGRTVDPGRVLEDGDRVEIYRPLVVDAKEARRRRAAAAR